MHEIFLFGQVPAARHQQVLSVLSGYTSQNPTKVVERHVIFRPVRSPPVAEGLKGGSQTIGTGKVNQQAAQTGKEIFYWRLVKEFKESQLGVATDPPDLNKGWKTLFYDVPEPGKRPVGLRMFLEVDVESDDPKRFMEQEGYKQVWHCLSLRPRTNLS
jgi:mediator of RNA polymerase II transcription subunit 18